ncbi:MAG: SDR family NAD(P)-dependent oxidoreductase [Bacteroidales bacterium]|nr:SDR family NAD(P)-dependent oxidoreductase [Bacteroidales bacterium]
MKKIAIVTGASSGMGQWFARTAHEYVKFDELWIIARRADRLEALASELSGTEVRAIPMDLTDKAAVATLPGLLTEADAEVVLLVNAAGFGKFQSVENVSPSAAESMLALNCGALMDMCYTILPFMKSGAKILNIASVAAFQPVPYVTEYAATKAFVLSFSRGLWKELRPKGITVTALCPYWTKTEFFDVANNRSSQDMVKYFNAMYEPEDVVRRGWRDLLKGRDLSTFGLVARAQLLLVKLLPHRLVMWIWCLQQHIPQ